MPQVSTLRIVHTESSCGWGGQEIRILTEAAGMRARGHAVTLICPADAPIRVQAERWQIPVVVLPIARKHIRGFRALRVWLAANPRIDVINTHSSTDSWLAALACATLARAPAIVRTRHVSTNVNKNFGTRWLYQRAAAHIVTTGEALRRQLHTDSGVALEHMTSIPTGIDLQRFRPRDTVTAKRTVGLLPERRYLGVVATLRNWKGHTYLLQAFADLAPRFATWDLLVIGDGPQRHNIEKLIVDLGLETRVRMVGNRDDVEIWLNALDLFVLPSYGAEGVSQSVMQAMASGLPAVSTTVGALAEAVCHEHTGLLVPPKDTEQLRTALAKLMDDDALRQRMGHAGSTYANAHFGMEHMLDRMERVFRRFRRGP